MATTTVVKGDEESRLSMLLCLAEENESESVIPSNNGIIEAKEEEKVR